MFLFKKGYKKGGIIEYQSACLEKRHLSQKAVRNSLNKVQSQQISACSQWLAASQRHPRISFIFCTMSWDMERHNAFLSHSQLLCIPLWEVLFPSPSPTLLSKYILYGDMPFELGSQSTHCILDIHSPGHVFPVYECIAMHQSWTLYYIVSKSK